VYLAMSNHSHDLDNLIPSIEIGESSKNPLAIRKTAIQPLGVAVGLAKVSPRSAFASHRSVRVCDSCVLVNQMTHGQ
jgi:hypothetical protein